MIPNPYVRFVLRLVVAGLAPFLAALAAGTDWQAAAIAGASALVALAAAELTTPINPNIGVGKGDDAP